MNKRPNNLILPDHVRRQTINNLENLQVGKPPKAPRVELPPEIKKEIKELSLKAAEIGKDLNELMSKGNSGLIALLSQPDVKNFILQWSSQTFPRIVHQLCKQDRELLVHYFNGVLQQKRMNYDGRETKVYQDAITDLTALVVQLEINVPQLQIDLPDFGLDDPEPNLPEDNQQE